MSKQAGATTPPMDHACGQRHWFRDPCPGVAMIMATDGERVLYYDGKVVYHGKMIQAASPTIHGENSAGNLTPPQPAESPPNLVMRDVNSPSVTEKRGRGRPRDVNSKTHAERQRAYRERSKSMKLHWRCPWPGPEHEHACCGKDPDYLPGLRFTEQLTAVTCGQCLASRHY